MNSTQLFVFSGSRRTSCVCDFVCPSFSSFVRWQQADLEQENKGCEAVDPLAAKISDMIAHHGNETRHASGFYLSFSEYSTTVLCFFSVEAYIEAYSLFAAVSTHCRVFVPLFSDHYLGACG